MSAVMEKPRGHPVTEVSRHYEKGSGAPAGLCRVPVGIIGSIREDSDGSRHEQLYDHRIEDDDGSELAVHRSAGDRQGAAESADQGSVDLRGMRDRRDAGS